MPAWSEAELNEILSSEAMMVAMAQPCMKDSYYSKDTVKALEMSHQKAWRSFVQVNILFDRLRSKYGKRLPLATFIV